MFHENAIEAEVREWITEFETEKYDAMSILLNLFLASSGAAESLTTEMVSNSDAIDKHLAAILKNFDPDVQNGYPLLPKAKGRIHQKFKKNLVGFLDKLMIKSRSLEEKVWLWQSMYQWLGAMSSSRFKPFRHSSTFIANTIQCSLCAFLKEVIDDLNLVELQLGSCSGAEPRKLLEKKVLDLNDAKEELESWTDNFFEGIFIHRCRDSDSMIRAECASQICSWMSRLKEKYMDPQYLRYVGWMLADKAPSVRLEYIKGLSCLLTESNLSNLRLFLDRFKSRIHEMATKDDDLPTRLVAIEVITKMSQLDLLDDTDSKALVTMLFETDPKVRTLAANMIPKILSEKQELVDESNFSSESLWEINCLCKILVESDASNFNKSALKIEEAEDHDELEMSFAEEDLLRLQQKDQKEMLRWLSVDWVPGDLSFGISGIKEAVKSLSETVPIVKDWQSMGDYLVSSFNDNDPACLSPKEDLCLLYLFSASIELRLNDSSRKKSYQEERSSITRELIKILPLLLKKYKNSFTGNYKRLMETLTLFQYMDLQVYLDLRMHAAFDELLSELKFVCTKHINPDVLICCVRSLPNIFSREEYQGSSPEKENGSYNHQILDTVKDSVKDILIEIIFDQLIPQYEILAGDSETYSKVGSAVSLRGVLIRFDILRCELGIQDYISLIGDSSFSSTSLLSILHGVIDKCLSMLTVSADLEENDVENLALLIDCAIKVAMKDQFFYFKKLCDKHTDDEKSFAESSRNAERLIAICEAVITSDESDGMELPLGLKFASIYNLMTLYIFFNSGISQKTGENHSLSEMVQNRILQTLEKSIIALSVIKCRPASFFVKLTEKGIAQNEMKLEIHQELLKSLVHFMQFLNHSLICSKFGAIFLKYFGLCESEDEMDTSSALNTKPIIMNMFGKTWNSLTETLMKSVLIQQFQDLMTQKKYDDNFEEKVDSLCHFLFGGVNAALDLYLSGVSVSLDPVRTLAKLIINQLKMWPKYLQDSSNKSLMELQSSVFNFFTKSCHNVIFYLNAFNQLDSKSNKRYSMISDLTINYDQEKPTSIHCHKKSIEEINSVWEILGAIGGVLRQSFDSIGIGFAQFDEFETSLLEFMNSQQVKPLDSSKQWEPFWNFLKAVGKGDSKLKKKTSKSKGEVKKRAKSIKNREILKDNTSVNVPVRRSSRARDEKSMRDDSSSEEDSWNENHAESISPKNAFVKASTPKNLLISKENEDFVGEIFSDVSNDDHFNQLSSIIKRKPPSEFETEDFASSPPALSKKVRY